MRLRFALVAAATALPACAPRAVEPPSSPPAASVVQPARPTEAQGSDAPAPAPAPKASQELTDHSPGPHEPAAPIVLQRPALDAWLQPRALGPRHSGVTSAQFVGMAKAISAIHQQIHASLAQDIEALGLGPADPSYVLVGIEIDGPSGAVVDVQVIQPSGQPALDRAALDGFRRSAPFTASALAEALLPDQSRIFLTWFIHAKPDFGCSTYFATPYWVRPDR